MTKLNELLRLNASHIEGLFKDFEENGELARFLILEGHLDDTYYQYTSLFHAGRLSPNDNKFLIQIRAFVAPEPSFPIDNPKEVIAAMRDEDFQQNYVLNVKLVDSLLVDQSLYLSHTQSFFKFISSKFESCEGFFDVYYTSGRNIEGLLLGLAKGWDSLVPSVIDSPNNISHVTQLVVNLPVSSLRTLARNFEELPKFVADNLQEILVSVPELDAERLKCLDFEVKDLSAIKEYSEIVRIMVEEGYYVLTIENLEYVYQEVLGQSDLKPMRKRNFTTICSMSNPILMERIERDFDLYLRDILLELQGNSEEDASAVLAILNRERLDHDDLREFIERQSSRLPTLDGVSEKLYGMLFQLNAIEPKWMNCLVFMETDEFEPDSLIEYLDLEVVRTAILQCPIPNDSESIKLREFLINADSLSDIAYREYVHALPKSLKKLPKGLKPAKLQILIEEGKIILTKENLEALDDSTDLQVLFVAVNIDIYLTDSDGFGLDDDFREKLLRSEIDNVDKLKIIGLMDLEALVHLPERSALIGPIIDSADAKISKLSENSAQSLITHSRPIATQISLLNKYHLLIGDDEIRGILANLPTPFSEIKTGYNRPRLEGSSENRDLVSWLDSRNIISSWSESSFLNSPIIYVNLYRNK